MEYLINISLILTIVNTIAKLFNIITWTWLTILSPLIITFGIIITVPIALGIVIILFVIIFGVDEFKELIEQILDK